MLSKVLKELIYPCFSVGIIQNNDIQIKSLVDHLNNVIKLSASWSHIEERHTSNAITECLDLPK